GAQAWIELNFAWHPVKYPLNPHAFYFPAAISRTRLGKPIVSYRHLQRGSSRQSDRWRGTTGDDRRLILRAGVSIGSPQERIGDGIFGNQQLIDFPFRLQPALRNIRSSTIRECPYHPLIFGPVLGHDYLEYKPSSARIEVRRLALIAIPQIKVVLRTERHIDLFV